MPADAVPDVAAGTTGGGLRERLARAFDARWPYFLPGPRNIDGRVTSHRLDWEDAPAFHQQECLERADVALTAIRSEPHALASSRIEGCELKHSQVDDDCGCPEEMWDTPWGELHLHLSSDGVSNACLDNGDYGERHLEVTAATIDEARAAIFGWAAMISAAQRTQP